MTLLYFLGVKFYGLLIAIGSLFNDKAKQWMQGRKAIFGKINKELAHTDERRIWFHCSSLGEFEQGRPLMEAIRKEYPAMKIVLTFFSPSGYEVKKNFTGADYVFYLPLDGPLNAQRFIGLINPVAAFFVKYEFWHFYVKRLKDLRIPVYSVSSLFRPTQIYFKWYGYFFKKILYRFNMLFVQNQASLSLLYNNSIAHVTVCGDTRFDRVYQNSLHANSFPEVEKFIAGRKVFIAGSTWPADDELLCKLINESTDYCFILAPHEIKDNKITDLQTCINKKSIRFSELKNSTDNHQVLIIDNIGMLSSLYRYADITYVGGGFGTGIHNVLEAVVFGAPVIFGPKHQKFSEALELKEIGSGFTITNYEDLRKIFLSLKNNTSELQRLKEVNLQFVNRNKGATEIIMHYIRMNWK